MTTPILEVIDLHKRYGEITALQRVSLQVEQGEVFGLLGPNGAGKTTLLSIVSCLLEATSGEVRLEGKRLKASDRAVRRRIGLVPQDLAIYGEMTARENLHFFGELYGLGRTDVQQRARQILQAMGLENRADTRVDTFSGGMKRRLNLGTALMHRPPLLMMDEPTTGVDPQSRNHIFEEVRRLNAEGVTVIYTSHYMEEVQSLCNRIAIIDNGNVAACDTLAGLLRLLGGPLRFRVARVTRVLLDNLGKIPDAELVKAPEPEPDWDHSSTEVVAAFPAQTPSRDPGPIPAAAPLLELRCRDARATVPRLLALLNDLNIPLLDLETEEPSLERVFLDLTEKTLRD